MVDNYPIGINYGEYPNINYGEYPIVDNYPIINYQVVDKYNWFSTGRPLAIEDFTLSLNMIEGCSWGKGLADMQKLVLFRGTSYKKVQDKCVVKQMPEERVEKFCETNAKKHKQD